MMTAIDLDMLTTLSWQALVWMLLAGFTLGVLFFGSLWVSTSMILHSRRPALWMVASFVLRMALVLPGFYWLSDAQWQKLLTCVVGFIIARFLVIRMTGKLAPIILSREQEKHAS